MEGSKLSRHRENVSPISRCQQSSNQRGRNVASIRSIVRGPPCNSTRLRFEPKPLTRVPSLYSTSSLHLAIFLSHSTIQSLFRRPIIALFRALLFISKMNNEFHRWIWFRLICICFRRMYSHKYLSWIFKIAIR